MGDSEAYHYDDSFDRGAEAADGPPFNSRRVWQSPSVAIAHDACAVCLGGGETFDVVLGRVGACSGCGGSGALTDMLARQCDDPDCPEHGNG